MPHSNASVPPATPPMPSQLTREVTFPSNEGDTSAAYKPYRQSIALSASDPSPHSTILTPVSSSAGDEPRHQIQPEPIQEPAYKPYVPSEIIESDFRQRHHSGSISGPPVSISGPSVPIIPPSFGRKEHDEIFIGPMNPKKPETPTPPASVAAVPIAVAERSRSLSPHKAAPPPEPEPREFPLIMLEDSLPRTIDISTPPDPLLEKLLKSLPGDTSWISSLHQAFEASAARTRAENEKARHIREQEAQERQDELYNDQAIGYGDIAALEEEFKEEEERRKKQEERKDYNDYVAQVFEPVFGRLQKEISQMTNIFGEAKRLVDGAYAGKKALSHPSKPLDDKEHPVDLRSGLDTLLKIQKAIDAHSDVVALAINDRDKRIKRLEIAALYALGNGAKLKAAEKHFDQAAKAAAVKAAGEKANRASKLFEIVEKAVPRGVGQNQDYMDIIMNLLQDAHAHDNNPDTETTREVLDKTLVATQSLAAVSENLMRILHTVEMALSNADYQYAAAEAKMHDAPPQKIKDLEDEMGQKDTHSASELERRLDLVQEDSKGAIVIVDEIRATLKKEVSEEEKQHQERVRIALEEARRRNGE